VAPFGWSGDLQDVADELIALVAPRLLRAIGGWYTDFSQSTDEEVVACLRMPWPS
jgi:predicted phosphoribosyltransferase